MVSAVGTPMLKSERRADEQVERQSLDKEKCSYLKWRVDPLFIGASLRPGCSDDPIGLVL